MRKCIALLLLIVTSSIGAMENNSSSLFFSTLRSLIPAWLIGADESSLVQDLRVSKKNFEQELDLLEAIKKDNPIRSPKAVCDMEGDLEHSVESWYLNVLLNPYTCRFKGKGMVENPLIFLYYCYYQQYHNEYPSTQRERIEKQLGSSLDVLNMCKMVQINGYSALGAAIVAKNVAIENKREFMQKLIDYGFKLTQKDRTLVELDLYDSIPGEQKKSMVLLLSDHTQGNLSILPHDVRKYIVHYILRPYIMGSLVSFLS